MAQDDDVNVCRQRIPSCRTTPRHTETETERWRERMLHKTFCGKNFRHIRRVYPLQACILRQWRPI